MVFKIPLDSRHQARISKEIIQRYIKPETVKAVIFYILKSLADLGQGLVMTSMPSKRSIHKERAET